ncbi:Card1-like endonuclease domain-containing protein [Synechococcus sp. PCC 7336]|uniref:Card1-like endonuclease domain-containing protein n=1 Tax=Synechococcus sp. PCC 7336 TaxID=195250 RepID=UPI00138B19AC|nr:DUF1887 family CARF protein [Synechococcus sp. PCC 7336]
MGAFGGATIAPEIAPVIARQLQRDRHAALSTSDTPTVLPPPTPPEPSTSRESSASTAFAPTSANGAADNRQQDAIEWFAAKSISIEPSQQQNSGLNKIFFEHAERIGQAYIKHRDSSIIANFLRHVRWAITNRKNIRFVFKKNASQSDIRILTGLCNYLKRSTFLSHYNYNRSQKVIYADVQAERGDIRLFLTGQWFEQFILHEARKILNDSGLAYDHLLNPKVTFQNEDSYEVDILFLVKQEPILIECKTGGNANAHLSKFSSHCDRLSINPSRAFLVILDLAESELQTMNQVWEFQTANIFNFPDKFKSMLS